MLCCIEILASLIGNVWTFNDPKRTMPFDCFPWAADFKRSIRWLVVCPILVLLIHEAGCQPMVPDIKPPQLVSRTNPGVMAQISAKCSLKVPKNRTMHITVCKRMGYLQWQTYRVNTISQIYMLYVKGTTSKQWFAPDLSWRVSESIKLKSYTLSNENSFVFQRPIEVRIWYWRRACVGINALSDQEVCGSFNSLVNVLICTQLS